MYWENIDNADDIRDTIAEIVRTNLSHSALRHLTVHLDRQITIEGKNESAITIRGSEDGLLEVFVICPTIDVETTFLYDIYSF